MASEVQQEYDHQTKALSTGPEDVLLDVPELHVESLELEVTDLRACVSLQADVLSLLRLNVGVDANLGQVKLDLRGVDVRALLKVRLDNVAAILGRVLQTIESHPDIVESLVGAAEETLRQTGQGAGRALSEAGRGAGRAVGEIGQGAGRAVGQIGDGAGRAVGQVGDGAGRAVGQVGDGAGRAVGQVGDGAGRAVGQVGDGAGRAVGQVAQAVGPDGQPVGPDAQAVRPDAQAVRPEEQAVRPEEQARPAAQARPSVGQQGRGDQRQPARRGQQHDIEVCATADVQSWHRENGGQWRPGSGGRMYKGLPRRTGGLPRRTGRR